MTKKLNAYPPVIIATWAIWEALRRLGFTADDIWVQIAGNEAAPESGYWMFVVLKTQDKEFVIHIMPLGELTPKRTMKLWKAFSGMIAGGRFDEGTMHGAYAHYFLQREPGAASLITALTAKGFVLPKSQPVSDA